MHAHMYACAHTHTHTHTHARTHARTQVVCSEHYTPRMYLKLGVNVALGPTRRYPGAGGGYDAPSSYHFC